MKYEVIVPSMGESIIEATVGQLLAKSGEQVKADQEIIELETDKVNQVLYAQSEGIIEWKVAPQETVKIGQVLGLIAPSKEGEKGGEKKTEEAPVKKEEPLISMKEAPQLIQSAAVATRRTEIDFVAELKRGSGTGAGAGTGTRAAILARADAVALKPDVDRNETRRPMSKIRKVIAGRLVAAQQTMAMLTTFNEVDLTHVIELREEYREPFIKKYGTKLGFMSFFVKAAVSALQAFPDLNSYIDGDEIVHREYYDIGVAVGTDKGVIVPVVRGCDALSFAEIEKAIEGFAKKAREGTLEAKDLQGGGFTITNGGIYGSLLSTPILLPPQCGILGMHKIEKRPVVIHDQITIRSMMYLALSYDHRLIDGKEAVSFLVHMKNLLEEPSRFVLEI